MPRLRRLSGTQVITILEELGFEVTRVKGSHYRLKIVLFDRSCYTTVPVHGNHPLSTGTLHAILHQISPCIPEDELRSHFYAEL
ncbi:MAG: hypothetical protein KatS3mg051_0884 [Anaerolineae bacterium]|jgi:predicted RNA binding protein YcfA (HicA-like mRNA interferase family)|nr:MAG: hypothetical protein KatS3mg051_0884 [Anaerolineae bacterium]